MIYSIITGIIAGFIGCKLTGREGKGCLLDLILGIVGAAVGGWLFAFLGLHWPGFIGEIGTGAIGAALFIWVFSKLTK